MSVFQALVSNDLKLKAKHSSEHFRWWAFYWALGTLIGIGSFTWALLHTENFDFVFSSFPYQFFILFAFLIPVGMIKKEWKQGTANWWLALPYSRKLLLGSKITASFIRYLKFIAITFLIIILLSIETIALRPEFTSVDFIAVIKSLIEAFIWQLAFFPAPLLLGTTLSVLMVSRLKPAIPLFWGLFIVLFNIDLLPILNANSHLPFENASFLFLSFIISLVIAVGLFILSTYLLEKQVEL